MQNQRICFPPGTAVGENSTFGHIATDSPSDGLKHPCPPPVMETVVIDVMETVVIDEDTLSSEKNNERVVAHQNLREAALVCGVASEVQLEVENLLEEDRSSGKVVFHPQ